MHKREEPAALTCASGSLINASDRPDNRPSLSGGLVLVE